MVGLEGISNHVEELEDEATGDLIRRVYCPTCGDPDNELGYAELGWVMAIPWKRVGNALCCSTYCAAVEAGHEEEEAQRIRGEAAWNDPITEEAVAAMPSVAVPSEFDPEALPEFGAETGGDA